MYRDGTNVGDMVRVCLGAYVALYHRRLVTVGNSNYLFFISSCLNEVYGVVVMAVVVCLGGLGSNPGISTDN